MYSLLLLAMTGSTLAFSPIRWHSFLLPSFLFLCEQWIFNIARAGQSSCRPWGDAALSLAEVFASRRGQRKLSWAAWEPKIEQQPRRMARVLLLRARTKASRFVFSLAKLKLNFSGFQLFISTQLLQLGPGPSKLLTKLSCKRSWCRCRNVTPCDERPASRVGNTDQPTDFPRMQASIWASSRAHQTVT